jgi:hypothetical protein
LAWRRLLIIATLLRGRILALLRRILALRRRVVALLRRILALLRRRILAVALRRLCDASDYRPRWRGGSKAAAAQAKSNSKRLLFWLKNLTRGSTYGRMAAGHILDKT